MTSRRLIALAALIAGSLAAAPVSAQLFKWVDEHGATHYSDRKPDDPKAAGKAKALTGTVSVFEQDRAVLQAVEVARARASRPPEPVIERDPPPPAVVAPAAAQQPQLQDPCAVADCGGYYYPAAGGHFRRRPVPLAQAQLKPGAIAGTVNSPGIIPGNTGTTGNLLPNDPPQRPRQGGKQPRFIQYEPDRR